ncbi:TetR/AcrR family transcriptional regulator [Roseovarius aestuarii]|uniref:HTH tetR-type domain-containing protein n=2 Tax=Roseovarius aestuarii TaxID=475083 RepID=A0A1X7BTL3_9RHOB|nr:TetR/AcrR family transcriptional regulator [Roseovarius aestuarii]SMC12948.1 hypothetical protein ROA7745_02781 [Roseovarius aestuarii]
MLASPAMLAAPNTSAYSPCMTVTATKRLTKSDWLLAGLGAVVDVGPDALKAEPLARRLGTTKGSFYWHFKDVPAFHTELLATWEMQVDDELLEAPGEESTAAARLRRLAQTITKRSTTMVPDPSIRAWARSNRFAAQAVARVDSRWLTSLQDHLADLGIGNPEMARIIYAAAVGMGDFGQTSTCENTDAIGSLVDLVLALR